MEETRLLGDGDYQTFTVSPPPGSQVMLVAIGDWDSNDVDLFVRGAQSGRNIDIDVLVDATR